MSFGNSSVANTRDARPRSGGPGNRNVNQRQVALALRKQPRAGPVPYGDTDNGNQSTNRIWNQAGVRSPHKHGGFFAS